MVLLANVHGLIFRSFRRKFGLPAGTRIMEAVKATKRHTVRHGSEKDHQKRSGSNFLEPSGFNFALTPPYAG